MFALQVVSHGILVFCPSYRFREELMAHWKEGTDIWDELEKMKDVLVEPEPGKTADHRSAFQKCLSDFQRAASARGAVLFAVVRGKVSA